MNFISERDGEFGIIAIGEQPVGIIAIGGAPIGFIAIGGMACGVFALGMFACGIVAIGGVAAGLFSYSIGVGVGGSTKAMGFGIGGKVRGVGLGVGVDVEMVGSDSAARFGKVGSSGWWPKALIFSFALGALLWFGAYSMDMFQEKQVGTYYVGMITLIAVSIALFTPWILKRSSETSAAELRAAAEAKRKRTKTTAATIHSLKRTGLSINDQPEVVFELGLFRKICG